MTKSTLLAAGCMALLTIGVIGCTPTSHQPMPDTVPQAWLESFNARRAQEVVAMYTEDCVVLPPDAPAVTGRQSVMEFLVPIMKHGITMEVTNQESETRDDLAMRRGTYALKNQRMEVTERGKYLQIWRRQKEGGTWLLSRDIWNTDEKRKVVAPAIIQQ